MVLRPILPRRQPAHLQSLHDLVVAWRVVKTGGELSNGGSIIEFAGTHQFLDPLSIGMTTLSMLEEVFLLGCGEVLITLIRNIEVNSRAIQVIPLEEKKLVGTFL